jgi:hypothetical protein
MILSAEQENRRGRPDQGEDADQSREWLEFPRLHPGSKSAGPKIFFQNAFHDLHGSGWMGHAFFPA